MLSDEEHLNNLIRHITLVRNACVLLGQRLMARGEKVFGRQLIARGHVHDQSKFFSTEWNWLHQGPDVPEDKLKEAVEQHVETNSHHPEFHPGGVSAMPELDVAEMVCDWYGRSQEFGTALRAWITDEALSRYGIAFDSPTHKSILRYVDLLLQDSFRRPAGKT
jgi:hypothetical protein